MGYPRTTHGNTCYLLSIITVGLLLLFFLLSSFFFFIFEAYSHYAVLTDLELIVLWKLVISFLSFCFSLLKAKCSHISPYHELSPS